MGRPQTAKARRRRTPPVSNAAATNNNSTIHHDLTKPRTNKFVGGVRKDERVHADLPSSLAFPTHLFHSSIAATGRPTCNRPKQERDSSTVVLEGLVPGYVWIAHNFMSQHECQAWINYMEGEGGVNDVTTSANSNLLRQEYRNQQQSKQSLSSSSKWELVQQRGTRIMAQRHCYRYSRDDPVMADRIYQRIQSILMQPHVSQNDFSKKRPAPAPRESILLSLPFSGCNANLRLYKYTEGMSFGKHIDESCQVSNGHTVMTALVYLSTCRVDGSGVTRFFDIPASNNSNTTEIAIVPQAGTLVLHLHGDDCLLHQADPVLAGDVKYVLRTDLVVEASPR